MEKTKKSSFDSILFITVLILTFFGLIMIFSASAPSALFYNDDSFKFVKSQAFGIAIGFVGMLFCASFDYRKYKKLGIVIYIVNIVLLMAVLIFGQKINGAKRWINIGFSFQPSEITKISVVILMGIFLSGLDRQKQSMKSIYVPLIVLVGVPCLLLIMQPHFSIIIIIALTVFSMLVCYGIKLKYYVPVVALGMGLLTYLVIDEPYRLQRIFASQDPFKDKLGAGWQIVQSLFAIGSGGLFGLGLTRSRQKHMYIPEPQNDYIFSIICEELGLIGAIVVIVLFVILFWRCVKIALECPDPMGTYIAFGMGMLVIIQVILNIAVATNLIPSTGIMLPFFSAGGSGILSYMMGMGIVLNISRHKRG